MVRPRAEVWLLTGGLITSEGPHAHGFQHSNTKRDIRTYCGTLLHRDVGVSPYTEGPPAKGESNLEGAIPHYSGSPRRSGRIGAVQDLSLALFIDAQHQGMVGRWRQLESCVSA